MQYDHIVEAEFLFRPNRFIAHVLLEGREETVHVRNTGRCRELLIPGVKVYLESHKKLSRKTRFSLVAVQKGNLLVNIDSQAPNAVVEEALARWLVLPDLGGPVNKIKREAFFHDSRLDFYLEAEETK